MPGAPRSGRPRAAVAKTPNASFAGGVAAALLVLATSGSTSNGTDSEAHRELERRVAECPPHDTAGRMGVINWALAHDLPDRAESLYREILAREPEHEEAYDGVVALARGRSLPRESPAYHAARQLLPKEFREFETRRYLILSNASPRWTRAQAERLARAHHQFHRYGRNLGLHPLPLRHKLVCVLFQNRDEFVEFAEANDGVTGSGILGYYSLRHDRIVFFNGEAEEDADEFASRRSITTTIHEAIHQLHYHTRVQSVHLQYPLWICEGLATAFETDAPNAAFGPDHDFEPRRGRFTRIMLSGQLLPLRALVQYDRMPDNRRETKRVVYGQSYALVTWCARHRKTELRDYLMLTLKEPPGRPTAQRHLHLFEQAFGDVDRLEQAWLHDEGQTRENAP